jgi:hypothetical protein
VRSAIPLVGGSSYRGAVSSNVGQNYPYSSETEEQRSAAVAAAVAQFGGLGERISKESTPLEKLPAAEPGRPDLWWVFVCPQHIDGRLHVAGYPLEKHGLYTVCDLDGQSFLR